MISDEKNTATIKIQSFTLPLSPAYIPQEIVSSNNISSIVYKVQSHTLVRISNKLRQLSDQNVSALILPQIVSN